jgi:hypothetical protein
MEKLEKEVYISRERGGGERKSFVKKKRDQVNEMK